MIWAGQRQPERPCPACRHSPRPSPALLL